MSSPYLGLFHEVALHALQYQSTFLFDHAAVLFSTSMILLIFPAVVSAETALQLKDHVMKKRHVLPVLPRASSPPKLFPSPMSAKASLDFVDRIAVEQSSRQCNVRDCMRIVSLEHRTYLCLVMTVRHWMPRKSR